MPPLRHAPTHAQLIAPYPDQPIIPTARPVQAHFNLPPIQYASDQENQPSPAIRPASKAPSAKPNAQKRSTAAEPAQNDLPANYLDIALEEISGEVPIYENVSRGYSPFYRLCAKLRSRPPPFAASSTNSWRPKPGSETRRRRSTKRTCRRSCAP